MISTSTITLTSATPVLVAQPAERGHAKRSIDVVAENTGSTTLFVGGSAVTDATGIRLAPGEVFRATLVTADDALYVGAGATTVAGALVFAGELAVLVTGA